MNGFVVRAGKEKKEALISKGFEHFGHSQDVDGPLDVVQSSWMNDRPAP